MINITAYLEHLNVLEVVSIPTLESLVLTSGEEHVSVREESHNHNAVIVSENGLVTVTKIQSPYSNILVG